MEQLSRRQIWLVYSGLLIGLLLASLDQTIVSTALPTIVAQLGNITQLSWVVTAYLLASTASTPVWGKLGDLYGRKTIFLVVIVVFLLGSILAGVSRSMLQLILFRGLQGLGAGGLLVTAVAIIGDIISPRERGKYQGIFGAVFGLSSIVGPLLGGYLVDKLSWRWVFYINIPIGLFGLVLVSFVLPKSKRRTEVSLDYWGSILMAAAATSLVLLLTLGGVSYPWTSSRIIGLEIGTAILILCWLISERLAKEPVLPLRLFRDDIFTVSSGLSFLSGFAMFGAITFLPLFLQVVQGVSPTRSGLRLVPMMVGLLISSTLCGQLISRTGVYKIFPILGTAILSVCLLLFSQMDESTSPTIFSVYMACFGFGLGCVVQVLVIAVQNSAQPKDMGVVTSGTTFFRSIGSSVGVAIFGAIFANLLQKNYSRLIIEKQGSIVASPLPKFSPHLAQSMPAETKALFVHAAAISLERVFFIASFFGVLAFALAWFLREIPLRTSRTKQPIAVVE